MAAIKPLSEIKKKWQEVTPGRAEYYKAGIQRPKRPWSEGAAAASDAWKSGVTAAAAEDRFRKGVEKPESETKWKDRATTVGPGRWSEGVRVAADDWERGFRPYHEVIAALELPPRGMKGDPANIERVRVIADALHRKKLGL